MKHVALILVLVALAWKVVGAHDDYIPETTIHSQMKEHHHYHLIQFLDSLYRASREKDTLEAAMEGAQETARPIGRQLIIDSLLQEIQRSNMEAFGLLSQNFSTVLRALDRRDSLYRASRETKDTLLYDTIVFANGDTAVIRNLPFRQLIPIITRPAAGDEIIYIRETVALDSVPIVKCWPQYSIMYIGCDTTGWRITKERITETRVKQ